MNIGIYGGTFDPPHVGHVTAAKAAMEALHLDKLLLIPDRQPPHKALAADGAGMQQRYDMTVLATAELGKRAEVSDMELRRTGASYTADTLTTLREQYPEDTLYLLMGSDMFLSLHTWHDPARVMALARIAPFTREAEDDSAAFAAQKAHLERDFRAQVTVVPNPQVVDVSSTEVRTALAQGGGENLLPPPVWGYIQRERLYGSRCDLKHLTPDALRPIALSYLKPKRMPHVLGTEQEAVRLARRYGADETKARIAALLHDCTKKLDLDVQLALCKKYGITLDALEQKALKLLHSKTGAAIARSVFGVEDDVCDAIFYHTTGKPDMTLLEKIIYLADYIEPTRDFPGVEELRKTVYEDLDRGLLLGLNMTIDEMEEMGSPVHHMTRDARDYLLKRGIQ